MASRDSRRHALYVALVGFLVLVGSGYYPVRVIGAFVAAALMLSALGNLLIVSALLGTGIAEPVWRSVNLRDHR